MYMFVYGCSRVLRDLSLCNSDMLLYVMTDILHELKLSAKSFRDILILSGTDYSLSHNNICLKETLRWYEWYNDYFIKHKGQYQINPP